jgi:hypothetical protein
MNSREVEQREPFSELKIKIIESSVNAISKLEVSTASVIQDLNTAI